MKCGWHIVHELLLERVWQRRKNLTACDAVYVALDSP